MDEKEILLKAFNIMLINHENGRDLCNGVGGCDKCPFLSWNSCPNCCEEYEEC